MKLNGKWHYISESSWYWLTYIILGLVLLAEALYYQHVLEELPCLLCIHVRLWILLIVILALIGLSFRKNPAINLVVQLSIISSGIGLLNVSYELLGTERGFIFSDCGFNLGLPEWLALDQWFPAVFRVETSCGYTPELLFGITMAEALMLLSIIILIASISIFLAKLLIRP